LIGVAVALAIVLASCARDDPSRPYPPAPRCPSIIHGDVTSLEMDDLADWCWTRPNLVAYTHSALTYEDALLRGTKQIWILDLATAARRYVIGGRNPSWSPDGVSITYDWYDDSYELQIWTVDSDTGHRTPLTTGPRVKYAPDWSPDGRWIAYGGQHGTSPDSSGLWLHDQLSGRKSFLRRGHAEPDWAPDGRHLVIGRVAVIDTARPDSIEFSLDSLITARAAWSPSGRELLFTELVIADRAVSIMHLDLDTREKTEVARWARAATWSPDGQRFIYTAVDSATNTSCLYLRSLDGTECRQLTHLSDYQRPDSTGP